MFVRPHILVMLVIFLLGGSYDGFAQKVKVKAGESGRDTVKTGQGKGDLKASQPVRHDTLKGGNGFIPRTVIDSFPSIPAPKDASKPATALTQAMLDSARRELVAMKALITKADTLLAEKKRNADKEWPADRIAKLERDIQSAKTAHKSAKSRLEGLEKKYKAAVNPPESGAKLLGEPKTEPANPSPPGPGKGAVKGQK